MIQPIAITSDDLWVLTEADCGFLHAFRAGIDPMTQDFLLFDSDEFTTEGLFPVDRDTGEHFSGIRWATTADIPPGLGGIDPTAQLA